MLAAICSRRGLPYLHLLQPNQYVTGSKPFGDAERAVAIDPAHPWAGFAREGYPLLRARGAALAEEGIAFYDLTQIYRDVADPIYRDTCCHVNGRGNRVLARRLAEILDQEIGPALRGDG